ncbi:FtsX-like permease family protein, partial [Casaltella massiliensis]|nr:FtsX-like permease family protein [Casaltella massiliensis]
MTLVLGFGGSILVLISILAIRERKYEIGVLRAMGMKKGKVALGLIFETLSMIFISLSIGLT